MEIINILFKFRSEAEVFFNQNRSLKLTGEWTASPAFYADASSVNRWQPPYDDEIIDEDQKLEIINKITLFSASHGDPPTPIYFD